jgi:hypothetical protein
MDVVGLFLALKEALNCSGRGFEGNQKRLNQSFVQLTTGNVWIAQSATET